jgi:SAM-dependent methyltransferase
LKCQLAFFDDRYSDKEMDLLYASYRRETYVRVRRSWEPWYSAAVNDAFAPGSTAVRARVQFATSLLRQAGLKGDVMCAVDFGGDQGQLFPDVAASRRIVVDVSDAQTLPGVERIASLDELDVAPDLVIAAHVFEHLAEPAELLKRISAVMAPGGHLYVEVPLDLPSVHKWHSRPAYATWLRFVRRSRATFVLLDFMSGIARQLGLSVPRLGVIKASEHINYFSADSLRWLLEDHGFQVLATRAEPRANAGPLRLGRLGIVARGGAA